MQRPVQKLGIIASLLMMAFQRDAVENQILPFRMSSQRYGPPVFLGKQMRLKHFNKKRHGKMLKRKHAKA